MRLCVLHPSYDRSSSELKGRDPITDPSPYLPGHEWQHAHLHKATAAREVQRLSRQGIDLFVNLCDGGWDEDRAGVEVVQTLERLRVPFTGPASDFYDPTRLQMKLAASYAGIAVPAFAFLDDSTRLDQASRLRMPLIVKHPASYSSIGLRPESRVTNETELRTQVARMVGDFGGALVEEFVAGREFTVLVTEPRSRAEEAWALTPFECVLGSPDEFKHFDLKWVDYGKIRWTPVGEPALAEQLRQAAARVFVGLHGSGYARCDFRLDAEGRLFFLEINPLCGLFYPAGAYGSADIILAGETGGHAAFLEHQLARALERHRRSRPGLEIKQTDGQGLGVHAARAFSPGEIIDPLEERAQHLVSRRHVEKTWTGIKRFWFGQYAFPISDGVFGMWSDNPSDWRPYNHSCDPNANLDGLDVVARRAIAAGEPVTLDYATFTGLDMQPFACACGARECRKQITGWDHLTSAIDPYGEQVSDYVAHAHAQMGRLGVQVQRRGDGHLVLVTVSDRPAGSTLCYFGGVPSEKSRHSVQIASDRHIVFVPDFLRLMSHQCRPNVIVDVVAQRVDLVEDVAAGEELGFFYPSTEWDMAEPFDCWCGAAECLRQIRGARWIEPSRLARYAVAPHITAAKSRC